MVHVYLFHIFFAMYAVRICRFATYIIDYNIIYADTTRIYLKQHITVIAESLSEST